MLVPFVECVVIERDTCLFLSQCLLSFFFLFDIFIHLFFGMKGTLFF